MRTRRQIMLEDRRQKMLEDRRRKLLKDRRSISRRNSRSSNSVKGGINGDLIPVDLLIEIISRLPVKSIATCRCVSKLWSSILGRTDFTEVFLARSAALPKLLLVCQMDGDGFIFSSPQLQNSHENSSSTVANRHMIFPFDKFSSEVCSYVNGLLCFKTMRFSGGRKCTVLVICNPSTGQSLTLPRVKTNRVEVMSFFGYDPIDKRFKLLSMTRPGSGHRKVSRGEHQVMTLGGNGKLSWRMIECRTPHHPSSNGICINGVLYYKAEIEGVIQWNDGIACFDIRSENFEFIVKANVARAKLVNYKGKLATLEPDNWPVYGKTRSFKLCVLEDAKKHEWTTHTYVLPPLWEDIVGNVMISIIGVTRTGEIVLSSYLADPFYFIYYNFERNTVIKVEIQGIDEVKRVRVHTFLDHVEDVKLGGVFRKP